MDLNPSRSAVAPAISTTIDVRAMAEFIAGLQRPSGEIPWSQGGKTDPWDHVESAMGLATAGYLSEARKAYSWLASLQLPDGSLYASYINGGPKDKTKDTNMSTYLAVGVLHYYLLTGNREFLKEFWPAVSAGINFALKLQAPGGEIYWAINPEGEVDRMALLTGCSSIYLSLKCALVIAKLLGKGTKNWERSLFKLGEAISDKPNLFNMMKSRFSMDWYYPVLAGAIRGEPGRRRIARQWEKFVAPGWGVRCVSDRPWVTLAETSELVITLAALGEYEQGLIVFQWITEMKYDDGSYWMGVTFPDAVVWPEERTSWTVGVMLIAHDCLRNLTAGHCIFSHYFWKRVRESWGNLTEATIKEIVAETRDRKKYQTGRIASGQPC